MPSSDVLIRPHFRQNYPCLKYLHVGTQVSYLLLPRYRPKEPLGIPSAPSRWIESPTINKARNQLGTNLPLAVARIFPMTVGAITAKINPG